VPYGVEHQDELPDHPDRPSLRAMRCCLRPSPGTSSRTSPIAHFTRKRRVLPPTLDTLTSREWDVFRLLASGLSNAEVGRALLISDTTVTTHVTRVLQKLEVRDRAQAIVLA
jgi:DNA-binding NarL/FixJ family response regulator